ncbi:hypothetical protein SPONN_2733 [uncultured Candidatus Thioglobus sp.]|nr:hypothetical protein SPONN_2733 [uncultured Candidatus Thioglobus sp.]
MTINIKSLEILYNKNKNFWMFHRVLIEGNKINDIYQKRGMLHTYSEIIDLMDSALKKGLQFGSIEQAREDENIIHLTFDDGYKEHLVVAKKLKKRYELAWNDVTFAINIRNSFYPEKFSMDLVYKSISSNKTKELSKAIGCDASNMEISDIKNAVFKSKKYISLSNELGIDLKGFFLNEPEVLEISKLFSIASHSINHVYLTSLKGDDILNELQESKLFLQSKLGISINTMCYPEGEHNREIREIAKQCGYKYGLSIDTGDGDYAIGRTIPKASSKMEVIS